MHLVQAIDETSRATLRRAGAQFLFCLAGALAGWLIAGQGGLAPFLATLRFTCTAGALWTFGRACRLREAMGVGPLNHWDQALILNGVGLALHIVQRGLG
jgi:hypothetical protein